MTKRAPFNSLNMIFAFGVCVGWTVFAGLLIMILFMQMSKTYKFPRLDNFHSNNQDIEVDVD